MGGRNPCPHGEEVRHRQPLRPAGGVPGADHPEDGLQERGGRAAVDLAEEVQQHPRSELPHLGRLGGRERLHRQGLRLPAGGEARLSRGGDGSGGSGALRSEAQPGLPADSHQPVQPPRPPRDGPLPLRLVGDLQRVGENPQRRAQPAQPGHAHRQRLERDAVRRPGAHAGPGVRPGGGGAGPRDRRRPHLRPPRAHRGGDHRPAALRRPGAVDGPGGRPTSTPSPGTASAWRATSATPWT